MNEFLNLLLPWWWGPISWITDSFISVIVLYATVSGIWFWVKTFRRRRLINNLTKETRQYNSPAQPSIKHQLKEKFEHNTALKDAWREFEDSLIEGKRPGNQEDENQEVVYKTDEASLFFSEERLLDQHLNLRFWNSVPALLVGLGILGTFVGMVWGLIPFSNVDFTNTNQIREAIKELLSGVSTAFVTSVWGMLASFLFNGLEKWGIGRVSRAIADLQRALDQIFTLTRAEEIAMRQQNELAQQTTALKSFSTDLADRIKIAMDNIMSERLENLHQSLTQLHDQNTRGRQEIIQELHNAPEAFSNAMVEQLAPSLDKLNEAIEELREQKEESATDAIRQLVEEFQKSISGSITAQMEALAERVSQVSEGLITLPDQMTRMIGGIQEQIDQARGLLTSTSEEQTGQMQNMMDGMLNTFQRTIETQQSGLSETTNQSIQMLQSTIAELQQSITSTASQTATESEAMTNRMLELLESAANRTDEQFAQRMADMETVSNQSIQMLQSTIETQQSGLSETTNRVNEEMMQIAGDIRNLLKSAANRTDEQFAQRMADMETVSNQSIQMLQSTITELQQSITSTALQTTTESEAMTSRMRELLESAANRTDEQLGQRMAAIETVSNQSIQTLQTAITELGQSITSTLNQQQQTISAITSQTAKASAEATDQMQQLVNRAATRLGESVQGAEKSINMLLQQQGDQIEAFNAQIINSQETLTKSREMLEQMNASAASVRQLIETTRGLSRELMTGATQLESAGTNLTQASDAFNQENERYLTANRETTNQIQNVLGQSQQLLNDSVQRFQTIDNGLQGIFAEIEKGLNEYTTTTRESINTYLIDFSKQFTQASTALASSVAALGENVDILNDMIERLPRR